MSSNFPWNSLGTWNSQPMHHLWQGFRVVDRHNINVIYKSTLFTKILMDSNESKHNLLEYISLNIFPECISLKYTVLYKFLELSKTSN